jgi:CubicO group peptidase (beta-lactamase class C family)
VPNRLASTLCLALFVSALSTVASVATAQTSLDAMLEPYLAKAGLPALGAAVVVDGKVVAAGAVGTRRIGETIPVTLNDRFHLGSDTKAMTSLLAAMLVSEGKIGWDSTVAGIFPELADGMDAGLRGVTLEQLLSHTSGIPGDNPAFADALGSAMLADGNLDDMRYALVRAWRTQPLASEPGTSFAYSNMGFTLAGAMLERVGGKTWEELVTERVFEPLGLASAGFGPQATIGKVDAPLGHATVDGRTKALLAGPNGDNPPVIGPAGTVHLSLLDFARWAGWNAGEGRRGPSLVSPETLKKLHAPVVDMPEKKDAAPGTPSRGRYALGWGEVTVEWAAEPFVFHGGSNTNNLAHIWIQPQYDFAMVLVTNIGGSKAEEALIAMASQLFAKFGPPKRAFAQAGPR